MMNDRAVGSVSNIAAALKEFKKTAYHHYGSRPSSIIRFVYYSALRVNTFWLTGTELTDGLPSMHMDACYRVIKPTLEELDRLRKGLDLPREFYYDRILGLKTCYLAFKDGEIAYIHWIITQGDYSRFLVLPANAVELNYNTTLRPFRGNKLMAKMVCHICRDLKENGFRRVYGIAHEDNLPSLGAVQDAGFRKLRTIRAIGPFNRKVRV